ncbi:MAG: hypothetical protein ABI901_11730, partial [Roseiflexaceae bacterium]
KVGAAVRNQKLEVRRQQGSQRVDDHSRRCGAIVSENWIGWFMNWLTTTALVSVQSVSTLLQIVAKGYSGANSWRSILMESWRIAKLDVQLGSQNVMINS